MTIRMPLLKGRPWLASIAVLAICVTNASAAPAAAAEPSPPIVFPVAGPNTFTDTWGAARAGGRTHEGTDIMADKMTPVVAVSSGTVGWMHNTQGGNCCAMALQHDDGWESWYIHLNNDTPGTDDGQGWGFAPGIESGVRVTAGQLIGWVGDSGNAESTSPHLHFELHDPSGTPVNPYAALLAAITLDLLRIAGADRYATAALVSAETFPGGSTVAFVASGLEFPDALAGSAVAAADGAPLLLVSETRAPKTATDELKRLGAATIYVLGGTAIIAESVIEEIRSATGASVERIAGKNRFETAATLSKFAYPDGSATAIVVNGYLAPDALSGAPVGGLLDAPMLLTSADSLSSPTERELKRLSPSTVYVFGGEAVVSAATVAQIESLTGASVVRVAGGSRYSTSKAIATRFFPGASTVLVSDGITFADALAAGPLGAGRGWPVILASESSGTDHVVSAMQTIGATEAVAIGGPAVLPSTAFVAICAAFPTACE